MFDSKRWNELEDRINILKLIALRIDVERMSIIRKSMDKNNQDTAEFRTQYIKALDAVGKIWLEKMKETVDELKKEKHRKNVNLKIWQMQFWKDLFGFGEEEDSLAVQGKRNRKTYMEFYEIVESLKILEPNMQGYQVALNLLSEKFNMNKSR